METRTIVITRRLPGVSLSRLRGQGFGVSDPPDGTMPRDALLRAVAGASGVLCTLADAVDAELMDAAGPGLAVVSTFAAGIDNIDVAEATRRGIRVCHTPDVLTDAVADLGFTLLLAAARRLPEAEAYLREGRWTGWDPWGLLGLPVFGATLGIVGPGKIGRALAVRARGFGMTVLYHGRRRLPEDVEKALGASFRTLEGLLRESDFVVLSVPLTAETRGLIDRERLRMMKREAVLVNISRGDVVDERALAEALSEDVIFGAGLDVYEKEPAVHPDLLRAPRTVLLPHVGSATRETRERMGRLAEENLLAVLSGREPPRPVN